PALLPAGAHEGADPDPARDLYRERPSGRPPAGGGGGGRGRRQAPARGPAGRAPAGRVGAHRPDGPAGGPGGSQPPGRRGGPDGGFGPGRERGDAAEAPGSTAPELTGSGSDRMG